jgi:hypothetical protein
MHWGACLRVPIGSGQGRVRRAKAGHHHHFAGICLLRYAQEASWREDNRRVSNGDQVHMVSGLAMKRGPRISSLRLACSSIERSASAQKSARRVESRQALRARRARHTIAGGEPLCALTTDCNNYIALISCQQLISHIAHLAFLLVPCLATVPRFARRRSTVSARPATISLSCASPGGIPFACMTTPYLSRRKWP